MEDGNTEERAQGGGLPAFGMGTKHRVSPPEDLPARLLVYLRHRLGNDRLDYAVPPVVMEGGTDKCIHYFRLGGAPPELSQMLVLRLSLAVYGTAWAVRERLCHDAVVRAGFPAPPIRLLCTDTSILGGAFMIMDFMPGRLQLQSVSPEAMPSMIAGIQAALHRIDPSPLMESHRLPGPASPGCRFRIIDGLADLKMSANRYPRLFPPVIDWLTTHFPGEPRRLSLCHGDLHPLNILVRNGRVTGVVDWTDAAVADPMFDVAGTSLFVVVAASCLPSWPNPYRMMEAYLGCYAGELPVDSDRLDYYRVYWSVVRLSMAVTGRGFWSDPRIAGSLLTTLGQLTGIPLSGALEPESSQA